MEKIRAYNMRTEAWHFKPYAKRKKIEKNPSIEHQSSIQIAKKT